MKSPWANVTHTWLHCGLRELRGSQLQGSQPLPLASFQKEGAHWSHLGPTTLGRHKQRPLSSSQGISRRAPRMLQSQPVGGRADEHRQVPTERLAPENMHQRGPALEKHMSCDLLENIPSGTLPTRLCLALLLGTVSQTLTL